MVDGEKSCTAETKNSYEAGKVVFESLSTKEDIFDCKVNKISILNLPAILFVLLILLHL